MARDSTPARMLRDSETRASDQDHLALRLWLRLLTATNLIQGAVRARLLRDYDITLPRFDLMAQLARAPRGLKMSELSAQMMVTGGNVTGIAAGLEADGLIARELDPRDGRVFRVRLTREGRRLFSGMAQAHEQWIIDMVRGVPAYDQKALFKLLGDLKDGVRSARSVEPAP
jgi:DNA-binding MarR family transcriptional regulator